MDSRRIWNVRVSFRMSTRIAVALVALASSAPATALDPAKQLSQFGYRAWTQQQGLPQDSVRVIAQARDGALWLGTDEGLARFDGTDFTVFRQSSEGLSGSFITALVAARDGSVWVGTLGGVSHLKDGRFTNYTLANGLGTPTVSDLFESQDGTIWAVGGRIVSAFRGAAIVNYGPEQGVPAEGLRKLVQTSDGVLFGVGFAEVVRFDGDRFQRHANRGELTDEFGTSITLDKDGVLWVGTTRGLLAVGADGRARRYDAVDGIPAAPVRAVLADRDGTLWIGTQNGLARREGNRFVRVSAPGLRPGVSVWDLFEDRDGGLWVGTNSGLHRFREQQFTMFGTPEGFPSDQPTAVFEDTRGTLWIGFQDAGLLAVQGATRRHVALAEGLPSTAVFCIRGSRDGAVLVGTRGGLTRIDARGLTTLAPTDSLGRTTVFDVAEDSAGRLWLATSNGVVRVEGSQLIPMFGGGPTLADAVVAVAFDRDGALWAGTYDSGLWRYKDGAVERFTQKNGLSSDAIRALVYDSDDVLWIGTAGGGLSWRRDGRFGHLTGREGLDSNNVGQIITGDKDYLWLGTSLGLARIRRAALFTGTFRRSDDAMYAVSGGLRSSQCAPGYPTSSGGRLDSKGRAWIVTSNGLAMIEPGDIRRLDPPPAPQIRAVIVDGRPVVEREALLLGSDVRRVEFQVLDRLAQHARTAAVPVPPRGSRLRVDPGGHEACDRLQQPAAGSIPVCRAGDAGRRRCGAGREHRFHATRLVGRGAVVPVGRAGRYRDLGMGTLLAAPAAGSGTLWRGPRRARAHLAGAARHARTGLRRHLVAAERRRQRVARLTRRGRGAAGPREAHGAAQPYRSPAIDHGSPDVGARGPRSAGGNRARRQDHHRRLRCRGGV